MKRQVEEEEVEKAKEGRIIEEITKDVTENVKEEMKKEEFESQEAKSADLAENVMTEFFEKENAVVEITDKVEKMTKAKE